VVSCMAARRRTKSASHRLDRARLGRRSARWVSRGRREDVIAGARAVCCTAGAARRPRRRNAAVRSEALHVPTLAAAAGMLTESLCWRVFVPASRASGARPDAGVALRLNSSPGCWHGHRRERHRRPSVRRGGARRTGGEERGAAVRGSRANLPGVKAPAKAPTSNDRRRPRRALRRGGRPPRAPRRASRRVRRRRGIERAIAPRVRRGVTRGRWFRERDFVLRGVLRRVKADGADGSASFSC